MCGRACRSCACVTFACVCVFVTHTCVRAQFRTQSNLLVTTGSRQYVAAEICAYQRRRRLSCSAPAFHARARTHTRTALLSHAMLLLARGTIDPSVEASLRARLEDAGAYLTAVRARLERLCATD
jgi:hypothetical protein